MPESKYTPGKLALDARWPGCLRDETGMVVVSDPTSKTKSGNENYANALRLGACWNACLDVATENLSDGLLRQLVMDLDEARGQRDALLAACKKAIGFDWRSGEGASEVYEALRSAVAKAEEGATNARLVAAAPDLLAACKSAWARMHLNNRFPEIQDQLYAAIAKAEGRS